jgi:hypothetical protein
MTVSESSTLDAAPKVGMRESVVYFLRLGLMGFGGPVALVGQMERELVAERKWLTREQMREAVAFFGKAQQRQTVCPRPRVLPGDGKSEPDCREVWISGNKIEFRGTGLLGGFCRPNRLSVVKTALKEPAQHPWGR